MPSGLSGFLAHILIVEDEKSISNLIAMNLAIVGNTSDRAFDGLRSYVSIKWAGHLEQLYNLFTTWK